MLTDALSSAARVAEGSGEGNRSHWDSARLAFSLKETAGLLGVSEKSVRRLLARGLLHSSNALRHRLIPRFEIERFLRDTL